MNTKQRTIQLHTDEGLPVVRGGDDGRGEVLLRGASLTEGDSPEANADFIRRMLETDEPIYIHGEAY